MENQSKERKAKLHCKSTPRLYEYLQVPWLNLSGLWLAEAGFSIGDTISISVAKEKLVIEVTSKAPIEKPYWEK